MPMLSTNFKLRGQIKARLLALQPRAFELFAGDLLEFMGLRQVVVTRYSGDGGIDATGSLETDPALVRIPIGVQVKRYRANVQRSDIDRFIGALSGQFPQGIFITTAGYTAQAMRKANAGIPRVAMVNGDQVVALMLQHRLGIEATSERIDDTYFGEFEAQAVHPHYVKEKRELYQAGYATGHAMQPEDDLISLRALSHALRLDTTTLRRRIETGLLRPDQFSTHGRGMFFRRDRIETIRAELLSQVRPIDPAQWRQEFLDFARSRTMTKSYKPVLLKALLKLVNRSGEVPMDDLVAEFRAFYIARKQAGMPVEFGPPNLADAHAISDSRLRQLIVKHPLERFLIKGFLEYLPEQDIVRFMPQLWNELRFWELLDVQHSADEQLSYYYSRR